MSETLKKDGDSALIAGVAISGSSRDRVLKEVQSWIAESDNFEHKSAERVGNIRLIFTPNTEIMALAYKDRSFGRILQEADTNIPDGVGLIIASRILRCFGKAKADQTISVSLPGVDLAHDLVMKAAEKGWRVFILGGRPGVAEEAGKMLEIEAKESGRELSGHFAWEVGRPEDEDIVKTINDFGPDILLVALGQGKQERWLVDHKPMLNAKVGMVVGGAVDFWAGRVRRAPRWVRRAGLEWLYRLIQEPWRWKRQLSLIEFGWLVLREAMGI